MGTIIFKSATGRFLRIYDTYNVCQEGKKKKKRKKERKKKVNGF